MASARLFCPACGIRYNGSLFVRYNNRLLNLHSFCLSSVTRTKTPAVCETTEITLKAIGINILEI